MMFHQLKLALAGMCLLSLSACDSESVSVPSVSYDNNTLIASMPQKIRQIKRIGNVPLELQIQVNGEMKVQQAIPNDISEGRSFTVQVPMDQDNEIKVEWFAVINGTRILLADSSATTGANQETVTIGQYIDDDDRHDFDGDGIFNLQEALENRNIAGKYDLEVPLQNSFLGARTELIPGSKDTDTSDTEFTPDENTKFSLRHDGTNMYLYVCGQDEMVQGDGIPENENAYWHDDTVFLYLDGGDSDNSNYDNSDDFQIAFIRSTAEKKVSKGFNNQFCEQGDCITYSFNDPSLSTECVYELNVAMPLADLNITPGTDVGFDLEITDDDDGGLREGSSGFVGYNDNSDLDPSTFSKIILR